MAQEATQLFPTQSVTIDRSMYRELMRCVPNQWFSVTPLPDDEYRVTFKAGEVPAYLQDEATPATQTAQASSPGFTPGPWAIHKAENAGEHPNHAYRFVGTADFDEDPSNGQILARLTDSPEISANARLIAAAPDLYAALVGLRAVAAYMGYEFGESMDKANAAIAKAGGK